MGLLADSGADVSVTVGVGGARRNAAAAVCVDGVVRGFCEQERVTRVRGIGLPPGTLPTRAVEMALRSAGGLRLGDVRAYAAAEEDVRLPVDLPTTRVDHHRAHAASAFLLSSFPTAAVLVCDRHASDHLSVWIGTGDGLARQDWPASSAGFAALYGDFALLFGFVRGQEHEVEAMARLDGGADAGRFDALITYRDGGLQVAPDWESQVAEWLAEAPATHLGHRARVASSFQRHLGELLVALAADLAKRTGQQRLCLGGGLFYNTYFTTLLRQSALYEEVFIAPNPGNAGAAVGAALEGAHGGSGPRAIVSPFLGPEYDTEDIKRTLDNCKLSYECLGDREVIDAAVDGLVRGQLVGWFQGRMEWGHRALGHRSILASPLSPYVLDNLNVFLKHRQHHRAYGVSVPVERAETFFNGPPVSRFMEYEYAPVDPELFRHVMPAGTRSIRVQTVAGVPDESASGRYRLLHEALGQATDVPVLVNTSFNGFSEPMVCSPRDAIRVFFGSGLDMLVLDRFVIRK